MITIKELIERLNDLISDRKLFLSGDKEIDQVFLQDIETLEFSKAIVELYMKETIDIRDLNQKKEN